MLFAPPRAAAVPIWISEKLQVFNHPDFSFKEKEHEYWFGPQLLTSVTTWGKDYCKPFDRLAQAERTAYFENRTVEDVLAEWDKAGPMGTDVHSFIERYLPNRPFTHLIDLPTIGDARNRALKFVTFAETQLKDFVPIALELRMFLVALGLAGTADALLWHVPTRTLWVFDWKTNKHMSKDQPESARTKWLKWPFEQYQDNKHNNYSIQLSWYRRILAYHGIPTAGGVLVHIPPGDEPAYMLKCRDMQPVLCTYFPVAG